MNVIRRTVTGWCSVTLNVGEKEALLRVRVLDLLDAPPHRGQAQDRVGLELDGFAQLVVLDFLVAFVVDVFDVRALAHDEAQDDAAIVGQ
jgi:hypothetical protein